MLSRPTILAFLTALLVLPTVGSSQPNTPCKHGTASARLEANGVSATIYNNGNLFWGGEGPHYNVPVGTPGNAIFTANIWIGGLVDGELRVSASDYGPREMWPGPIDDAHLPPSDCTEYDRIYNVRRRDIRDLDAGGVATADIRDWPWYDGAPVKDSDGNPNNYNLKGGDRPDIEGDQTLWWVMNDLAGPHDWSQTPALGLEVRVMAFSASDTSDINNTTFYRYTLVNRSGSDIDSMYFAMFVDPDLGDAGDDYVGSDSTLGLGYVWNGDDFDDGFQGYGDHPPALGVTVVEGPPISHFVYYNGDGTIQGNPFNGKQAYQYMKSLWTNGEPVTFGGTGLGFSDIPAPFMFPGHPPEFWSEENTDGTGIRNSPADRRFVPSSGPFTLPDGASQEITLAIVWASGKDRFDSVDKLLEAVPVVRQAYNNGLPPVEHPLPTFKTELLSPGAGVSGQPTHLTLSWEDVPFATGYELEISSDTVALQEDFRTRNWPEATPAGMIYHDVLLATDRDYRWRIRPANSSGYGPWSESRPFSTGSKTLAGPGPLPITPGGDDWAFIQVQGIGDDDACGPSAGSTFGCDEVGGNDVYGSLNGSGDWLMDYMGSGPEHSIGLFTPHDFEIRATDRGSYGYFGFSSGNVIWIPLEAWDIGDVGPFGVNDTTDDVQLIPILFSDNEGECFFGFGEIAEDPLGFGWPGTDRVYAYYPVDGSSYSDWELAVKPLVDGDPDACPGSPETDAAWDLVGVDKGRPLQRLVWYMDPSSPDYRDEFIPVGNIIRFLTVGVEPPQQSAPAPGSVVSSDVTLYWQLPPNEDSSRVQITAESDFASLVLDEMVEGKHLDVSGLADGDYHWRVSFGGEEWSEAWSFTVVVGTSSEDNGLGLPTALELRPAYPNPFVGQTTLTIGLPRSGRISIDVYDLLGRRLETIASGDRTAGWHTLTWEPGPIASGMYFITLESAGARQVQPVVIAK